jgi:hypothetical protein
MPDANRERFLVASKEAGLLSKVEAAVRGDPQVELVDVNGPPDQPDVLVVAMTPDRAEQLKQQFTDKLIVEKDAPLRPL